MECSFDECASDGIVHLTLVRAGLNAIYRAACPAHAEFLIRAARHQSNAAHSRAQEGGEAQVRLVLVLYDEANGQSTIFLRDEAGAAALRIQSGHPEAACLHHILTRPGPFPRPTTHDAFLSSVKALGGTLEKVLLDEIDEPTCVFFAKLVLRPSSASGAVLVDVRPSDAIALSLLSGVPIMVTQPVLAASRRVGADWGAESPPGPLVGGGRL